MYTNTTARLLITCPDRPGIVAAVSAFLNQHGANITALDQHSTDPHGGTFFMRLEFQTPHLGVSREQFKQAFVDEVALIYAMDWKISFVSDLKKAAILVSKHDHVLLDLLWRWSRQELPFELSMVISNHDALAERVAAFGVPFHVVETVAGGKDDSEMKMLKLLQGKADLLILARYMQIVSKSFITQFSDRIINIHHSFLPAFVGADPYQQAFDHGVKVIGATAHYVTEELDAGPIINQDVARISHRHSVEDMRSLGCDLERTVLTRAVKWHLEERIIEHQGKTIVFV